MVVVYDYMLYMWFIWVDEPQKISQGDKDMVRDNILLFVAQVPPLLRYFLLLKPTGVIVASDTYLFNIVYRVQLGECLKTIIHADYPEQWPRLLDWVKHNLQQDQQVFPALFVLRILSRKYEYVCSNHVGER